MSDKESAVSLGGGELFYVTIEQLSYASYKKKVHRKRDSDGGGEAQ